ncbi:hypothetical protein [Bdellovibrio sp. HCB2-146]
MAPLQKIPDNNPTKAYTEANPRRFIHVKMMPHALSADTWTQ